MTCIKCKANYEGIVLDSKDVEPTDTVIVHLKCGNCGFKQDVFLFEIKELIINT